MTTATFIVIARKSLNLFFIRYLPVKNEKFFLIESPNQQLVIHSTATVIIYLNNKKKLTFILENV